jgi:hypothetical protein
MPVTCWTPEAEAQLNAFPSWWELYHRHIALSSIAVELAKGEIKKVLGHDKMI